MFPLVSRPQFLSPGGAPRNSLSPGGHLETQAFSHLSVCWLVPHTVSGNPLDSPSSSLYLPRVGATGMSHNTWLLFSPYQAKEFSAHLTLGSRRPGHALSGSLEINDTLHRAFEMPFALNKVMKSKHLRDGVRPFWRRGDLHKHGRLDDFLKRF